MHQNVEARPRQHFWCLEAASRRDFCLETYITGFSASGKTPSEIEVLHIKANMFARNGRARFTNQFGAGSSMQCLVGEFEISGAVTCFITDSAMHGLASMTGGGALAVVARIMSTLSLK